MLFPPPAAPPNRISCAGDSNATVWRGCSSSVSAVAIAGTIEHDVQHRPLDAAGMLDLLALDVTARLALRLEIEADGPRLALLDSAEERRLGHVRRKLARLFERFAD